MSRQRAVVALLVSVLIGACDGTATPAPSSVAVAAASASAEASAPPASSPTPSPSSTPTSVPAPTVTPSATPSPVPTPAPTPVPWKSYTSKRYHYKMQYPPDWVVTPGNAEDSDMFDNYGYPYIYVSRDVVSTFVSINRTVTSSIAYYKSHYKAKVLSNKAIKLANGYSGRILTYSGTDDGLKVIIKEIIVAKGKVGYFIAMFGKAEDAVANKAIFGKIYLTWRATN